MVKVKQLNPEHNWWLGAMCFVQLNHHLLKIIRKKLEFRMLDLTIPNVDQAVR